MFEYFSLNNLIFFPRSFLFT